MRSGLAARQQILGMLAQAQQAREQGNYDVAIAELNRALSFVRDRSDEWPPEDRANLERLTDQTRNELRDTLLAAGDAALRGNALGRARSYYRAARNFDDTQESSARVQRVNQHMSVLAVAATTVTLLALYLLLANVGRAGPLPAGACAAPAVGGVMCTPTPLPPPPPTATSTATPTSPPTATSTATPTSPPTATSTATPTSPPTATPIPSIARLTQVGVAIYADAASTVQIGTLANPNRDTLVFLCEREGSRTLIALTYCSDGQTLGWITSRVLEPSRLVPTPVGREP